MCQNVIAALLAVAPDWTRLEGPSAVEWMDERCPPTQGPHAAVIRDRRRARTPVTDTGLFGPRDHTS